jgi:glycerophosphoryl diester phosphodiesterase
VTSWPYPFWIAHRGAGTLAPENTLAAFRVGAGHGYRAFECDVKLSADGEPFLLHDADLDRTTDGQGPAGQQAFGQLALRDAGSWHSARFAGEPMPSLAAVARYVLANGFQLNIEIKPTPGLEAETGRRVAQAAAQLWAKAQVPPLLSSFEPAALLAAREAAPLLPRGLLLETWWDGALDMATQALDTVAVITHHRMMDGAALRQLRARHQRALCYTVNDPDVARRLVDLGVDGLITDAVDRFCPALGPAAAASVVGHGASPQHES